MLYCTHSQSHADFTREEGMRWLAILFAVGLAAQVVAAAAEAAPRSFVRQCERQGFQQGTPEFKACIAKREATVKREREAARRKAFWSLQKRTESFRPRSRSPFVGAEEYGLRAA